MRICTELRFYILFIPFNRNVPSLFENRRHLRPIFIQLNEITLTEELLFIFLPEKCIFVLSTEASVKDIAIKAIENSSKIQIVEKSKES